MAISRTSLSDARKHRGYGNCQTWQEGEFEAIFGTEGKCMGNGGKVADDRASRGDYGLCRDLDKNLKDYHRYKDLKDRTKINLEYQGKQKEYRNNKVLGK